MYWSTSCTQACVNIHHRSYEHGRAQPGKTILHVPGTWYSSMLLAKRQSIAAVLKLSYTHVIHGKLTAVACTRSAVQVILY